MFANVVTEGGGRLVLTWSGSLSFGLERVYPFGTPELDL
jgi:hypothetical protein